MKDPQFIIVDLFCGAGGTTTGFEMANGIAKVIACVNHDANAIKSHWENHPDVFHFTEDIRTLDLTELIALVNKYRLRYPNAKLILWASLECTNFSKAKGGLPRDADSRTLADCLIRYINALQPEIIQIENVVEFMSWGELDERGKPVSRNNGKDWMRWRKEICNLGYHDEWKQLNAADFGAYTSRNRLFGMFAKEQDLIIFPEPTHFKKPSSGKLFDTEGQKWKPVKEVLDLDDDGNTIFGRKKDLSEKTLERIYAGLIKFIAGGDTAFIAKYYSGRPEGKVKSIEEPSGTIKCIDGHSVIQTHSLLKYNSVNQKTGKHNPPSIDEPCPVVSTQSRIGVIKYCFLTKYHGTGTNISSIENPASTISTKDRLAKVQPIWIDRNFTNGGNIQSIESPAGALLSTPKMNLVKAEKFIVNSNFKNKGNSIEQPAPTITASRKHHYLLNPQWGINCTKSIEKPCFTLIARMDKMPPYIISTESGEVAIEVYESDSPMLIKIKEFMAAYGIVDIKMRMLKIPELLRIQGFGDKYILKGTQTEQKKFIGNAVHPLVPKFWIEAIAERNKYLLVA